MSTRTSVVDLGAAKSVGRVLSDSVRCYGAYVWLFAALTVAVVAPYAVLVWIIDDQSLFALTGSYGVSDTLVLFLLPILIVQPFISALHVNALVEIGQGRAPALADVFRRGVRALPVVAAAEVMSALGTGLGFILLIVPGILLLVRWTVVAQTAAIERVSWLDALRRSAELTKGNYLHVLGVVISVTVTNLIIGRAIAAVVGSGASIVQILVGLAVQTVLLSFAALTTAMLYYDLIAREPASRAQTSSDQPSSPH